MKKFLIKGLILIIILALPPQGVSMSFFSDTETASGNTFSAGCWGDPSTPTLIYPDDGYVAGQGSDWLSNPYMDWDDSWACPGKTVTYQYESYHDEGLNSLAYVSGVLPTSEIPAPGTPNGTYYWRVRAHNGDNWSDWSDVWLLIVDRSIPSTTLGSANNPIGDPATSPPETPEVVINEILPNPSSGQDWIELYNRSDTVVDLASWKVSELSNPQTTPSENFYDISSLTTNTGLTTISPHGWLVIYFSGYELDNDGDTVAFYNDLDVLQDTHTYSETVPPDKSIARYPDGSDAWYDPIPTPGGPNLLETESDLEEPDVSEPSAELNNEGVFEEEAEEPVDEDASGSQDPTEPPETDQDTQTQADENSEQEAVIEESENETQGASGDEPVSEPEMETIEPQPEEPGQTDENNETFTE